MHTAQENSLVAIPEFVAGIMEGLVKENHLAEIQTCFVGSEQIALDVEAALGDLKSGEIIRGIRLVKKIMNDELPADLANCHAMSDDLAAVKEWASIFESPSHLVEVATKNWLFHKKAIKGDIANEEAAWAAGNFFQAGEYTADIITALVGPIPSPDTSNSNDVMAIPDFLAGFIYGFTGDNDLTELEACFSGGQQLAQDVMAAVHDLEGGALLKGAIELRKAINSELPIAMAGCSGMDEDMAALKSWEDSYSNIGTLTKVATKNWLLHKRRI